MFNSSINNYNNITNNSYNKLKENLVFIKNTHPNIYKYWILYLNEREKLLINETNKINLLIHNIKNKNIQDFTKEQLITLQIMSFI